MASTTTNRIQWFETFLMIGGVCGLGIITLWNPSTSQIHASPGRWFYWFTLCIPAVGLTYHLSNATPWHPPSRAWLWTCLALAGDVMLSALASPYREVVLRWSAPWLSAIALFFWVHARLGAESSPGARQITHRALALSAVLVFGASLLQWSQAITGTLLSTGSIRDVLSIRNSYPFGHSNYVAGAALLGMPWIWRAARRANGSQRITWLAALGLGILTLFTSGSRGGMLGLGAWVALEILFLRLPWRRLVLVGAIALVLTSVFAISNPRIRGFLTPDDPRDPPNISTVQRAAMTKAAWLMGEDRPILGWGLHATPLVYPRYRAELDGGAENVLQLHGAPQEIWAGLGSVGMLLIIALAALSAARWQTAPSAASAMGAYAVFALTDYQADVPFIVFALAINGALLAPSQTTAAGHKPRTIFIALILLCGGMVGLRGHRDPTPSLNSQALILATKPGGAQDAVSLLHESIQLNPYQEIAHFNLGWLLLIAAPETAASHFRAAAALVPDKGGVYFGLGLAQLNAGNLEDGVCALALECLNDPAFMQSRWWAVGALASLRDQVREQLVIDLDKLTLEPTRITDWQRLQIEIVRDQAISWGPISAADGVRSYRRQRTGYPVLMRNQDIPIPIDLYDVQDPPPSRVASTVRLPPKGWLHSPLLLKLLDQSSIDVQ